MIGFSAQISAYHRMLYGLPVLPLTIWVGSGHRPSDLHVHSVCVATGTLGVAHSLHFICDYCNASCRAYGYATRGEKAPPILVGLISLISYVLPPGCSTASWMKNLLPARLWWAFCSYCGGKTCITWPALNVLTGNSTRSGPCWNTAGGKQT